MKKYSIARYQQEVQDVTKMYDEGLITDFEYLIRMRDLTMCYSNGLALKLGRELKHIDRELSLAAKILGS